MGQTAARRAAGVVVEMVKEGQSAASPGLNLLIYWPYFIQEDSPPIFHNYSVFALLLIIYYKTSESSKGRYDIDGRELGID